MPPRTETRTPRPSLTRHPSQRAKSFAQNGEGLKTSLGWRVQPIFLFVLGVMVFHRFALVHTRVGIQGTKYWCGSHYVEKNFVACKIATTYGEDLSLEGGVVLNNTSILI